MKYVFNALILPVNFDKHSRASFELERIPEAEACREIRDATSVLGHDATVELINRKCGTNLAKRRETVFMEPGDEGIHFFLKERQFGVEVGEARRLEGIGYWWVRSRRIE